MTHFLMSIPSRASVVWLCSQKHHLFIFLDPSFGAEVSRPEALFWLSLCFVCLPGAARASCTWSSASPQKGATCWGRTAPPSPPSPKSSTTTPRTSCPSEGPSTCPCCTPSSCRPSDTAAPPPGCFFFYFYFSSWCYWIQYLLNIFTCFPPLHAFYSSILPVRSECLVPFLSSLYHNCSNYTGSLTRRACLPREYIDINIYIRLWTGIATEIPIFYYRRLETNSFSWASTE